ncbi:MAG: hypothetical protein ACI4SG_06095 [Oligosphaeraceae bacterium]
MMQRFCFFLLLLMSLSLWNIQAAVFCVRAPELFVLCGQEGYTTTQTMNVYGLPDAELYREEYASYLRENSSTGEHYLSASRIVTLAGLTGGLHGTLNSGQPGWKWAQSYFKSENILVFFEDGTTDTVLGVSVGTDFEEQLCVHVLPEPDPEPEPDPGPDPDPEPIIDEDKR